MTVRFEYFQSEVDGQWYFQFVSSRGEIIIMSAGYDKMEDCLYAIDLIKFYADVAPIIQPDVDLEAFT